MATSRTNWLGPALVAAALGVCYAPVISGLIAQWWNDEDMSHGFLVPLFIAWVVWRERSRWLALTPQPSAWGFLLLACGLAIQIASAGGGGLFAGAVAMMVSVAGVVLAVGGFAYLRAWQFPLVLSLFMLPKLAVVYNQVTLPLQLMATRIAAAILRGGGLEVAVDGNIIRVATHRIAVEEACNGIRYLLSLGLLSVMFAYFYDRKAWMRWALFAAAVPVAIGANALRVASAAWLARFDPAYAEGAVHTVSGALIFAVCLPALAAINWLFQRLHTRTHEI